jgi:hypothetical protein
MTWRRPRWDSESTLASCAFVAALVVACLIPIQNDTWWHLRAGREMWTRHFVMLTDEFSFTAAGAPFPNHEWLAEVVFYAVYRVAGLPGLTFLAALMIVSALALSWRLMSGAAAERLLIMALALTPIVPVWTVRPHVFTLLFVMVLVHLALREWHWPIVPLFVVWANLHGGVALGLVALGGVTLGTVYSAGVRPAARWVAVGLGAFAATFATPLGYRLWTTIPESVHKSTMNHIGEWRPPSLSDAAEVVFWITAALLIVSTVVLRRTVRSREHAVLVAVALVLLPLAIRYRRNIPPFMLLAIPALTHTAGGLVRSRTARVRENPRLNATVFAATVLTAVSIVATAWLHRWPRLGWDPMSTSIANAAQACDNRVFNSYTGGGYLIWFAPRVRVYIDSRQDPYPLDFIQEYIQIEWGGDYHAVFDRYGIKCAVLPPTSPTATQLIADGWRTLERDTDWVVLTRE